MKKILFIIMGLALLSLIFTACQKDEQQEIVEEPKVYCPLDHAELDEATLAAMPGRPIVVTIDNQGQARPQSGISSADIVYEIPAEGGISRYLAVFYHGSAEKIGPVRSARPYLVDIAKEWNAVYIHCGGSQDALKYLANGDLPYANQFSNGKYFWRDKNRNAPHNLYTSSEELLQLLEDKGWNESVSVSGFNFLEEGQTIDSQTQVSEVEIKYPAARDEYVYDSTQGGYLRYVNGDSFIDAATDAQIIAANILVQEVHSTVLDSEGRLAIDMVSSGDALLFTQGLVKEGVWQRDSLSGRTVFKDAEGGEWPLSPGQTWIQVVDQNVRISYRETPLATENSENQNAEGNGQDGK